MRHFRKSLLTQLKGLQTQPAVTPRLYNGPLDCAVKLYKRGGLAGVFKGQVSTMWRDGVGYGYV